MKIGDIVTIKNNAGMLKARIEKELSLADITRGIGDDKLPGFSRPRLEYHKGPYGQQLITYCGDLDTTPFNIYIYCISTTMVKTYRVTWVFVMMLSKTYLRPCIN